LATDQGFGFNANTCGTLSGVAPGHPRCPFALPPQQYAILSSLNPHWFVIDKLIVVKPSGPAIGVELQGYVAPCVSQAGTPPDALPNKNSKSIPQQKIFFVAVSPQVANCDAASDTNDAFVATGRGVVLQGLSV